MSEREPMASFIPAIERLPDDDARPSPRTRAEMQDSLDLFRSLAQFLVYHHAFVEVAQLAEIAERFAGGGAV